MKVQLGFTALYNQFHNPKLVGINGEPDEKTLGKTRGKQTVLLWKHFRKNEGRVGCSYNEAVREIVELWDKHRRMDLAVLKAYGWEDISPAHDFYEVEYLPENDRVRYTISPEAGKEVLKRLLELNFTYHEEEVAKGLADEKGKPVKKGKGKKRANEQGPELNFG